MNNANIYAYLIGILSFEAQRRTQPPGQINNRARELWHTATGVARPPQTKANVPLPELGPGSLENLRGLLAECVSPEATALLVAYLDDQPKSGSQAVPAPQASLYQELLTETTAQLQVLHDKPEETAQSTLRALWHAAAGTLVSAERAAEISLPSLDPNAVTTLRALLAQRFAGIPLAHLTGRQRFMNLELRVGKAALVPRKETELLGSSALALLRQMATTQDRLRVIDVCTGAGNLASTLATHVPQAQIYASDLSSEAVDFARDNSVHMGLGTRIEFRQGDFLAPFADGHFDKNIDLLVCNPPYISSGKVATLPGEIIGHEPVLAFDGGPFGVKILQRLISEAPLFLRAGGWLAFEVGLGQGPAITDRLRRNPLYLDVAAVEDANGAIRAVVARV